MQKRNLNIFGSGSSGGGEFNKIKISGDGTITDALTCQVFKVYGTGVAMGDVKAESLDIYGTIDIHEKVKSGSIKIYGTMSANKDVAGKEMKIRGAMDVGGNVSGEDINLKGSLSVKGDCEVENFILDGSFEIGGLLNAGKVNIELKYGNSSVKEIGGEEIQVKRKSSFLGINKQNGSLDVDTIEGDHIYVEYTKASVIRGKKVEIGPGCDIGLVEYNEQFHCAKNSNVKKQIKI
ncbi:cytoplasmic protein [Bacillus sp. APMAM]|nr:cytoplasmic protein [Bacillus sp. APMAM]RTZ56700.1 cytoplasmic protein [Bacillus sp. SAJ1]